MSVAAHRGGPTELERPDESHANKQPDRRRADREVYLSVPQPLETGRHRKNIVNRIQQYRRVGFAFGLRTAGIPTRYTHWHKIRVKDQADSAMQAIQVMQKPSRVNDLEASAVASGQQIFHIDLSNAHSQSALIAAVGVAIGFPDYVGGNWDALEESLRDLKESNGWLLIFANADGLLRFPATHLSTLLSILSDTAAFWENEGHSFRTVFVGSPRLAVVVEGTCFPPTPA